MRDLRVCQAAGCRPHLVRTGKLGLAGDDAIASACAEVPGLQVHADLAAFAEALVRQERAARGESGGPASGYGHLE
jgi:D-glycero-D-manno-heptose 1,7-bisphosphate phosphatase